MSFSVARTYSCPAPAASSPKKVSPGLMNGVAVGLGVDVGVRVGDDSRVGVGVGTRVWVGFIVGMIATSSVSMNLALTHPSLSPKFT